MKNIIRKIFPNLFPYLHLFLLYYYDFSKFRKSTTSINPNKRKSSLQALVMRQTHGVEKALTLPNPRLGFGKGLLPVLLDNISLYYQKFGYDEKIEMSLDVLKMYKEFNKTCQDTTVIDICKHIDDFLNIKIIEYKGNEKGGVEFFTKEDFQKQALSFDFEAFCNSRFSIRNFDKKDVSIDLVQQAVKIASKTPSACNRQPWKIRIYKEQQKEKILDLQNGNRGFRETVNTVILITSSTSLFTVAERHAAWIDGGMFSMSLIYALHSLGLGVCALNTSYTVKEEQLLRNVIGLNAQEEPIMMLAVGHLLEEFAVAKSGRRELDEIIIKK